MWGWSTCRSMSFSTSRFVCHCSSSSFWVILQFLIGISQRATITTMCSEGIWQIVDDRLPIVKNTGHSFLLPAKFERCILSDMKIKGISVSATVSVDLTLVSTSSSLGISQYLCLPPPVCSVHFGIEVFWWCITVKAMLRGVNKMLGVSWLPHQPSHALMMSQLQYLIGLWWLSFHFISLKVCSSNSPSAWSSGMLAITFWTPSLILKLGKCRAVFASFRMLS